jgi:predicted RNA-binding protein with PUA-like domain
MNSWLVKTEPTAYSFGELTAEKKTLWSGVKNPQAQLNLRAMKRGDQVAVYHTGGEKAVVGLAVVTAAPSPDPTDKDGKRVAVELSPVGPLAAPVTLSTLRAEPGFATSPLITQGRLSVVPLTAAQWKRLSTLGRRKG